MGLNAPFGARCFLTDKKAAEKDLPTGCLNAPFGARCFLTRAHGPPRCLPSRVLMHLLALGAF